MKVASQEAEGEQDSRGALSTMQGGSAVSKACACFNRCMKAQGVFHARADPYISTIYLDLCGRPSCSFTL